jgi:hypothetical protein
MSSSSVLDEEDARASALLNNFPAAYVTATYPKVNTATPNRDPSLFISALLLLWLVLWGSLQGGEISMLVCSARG